MHFNKRGILTTGPFCMVQASVDSAKPRAEEGLRVRLGVIKGFSFQVRFWMKQGRWVCGAGGKGKGMRERKKKGLV